MVLNDLFMQAAVIIGKVVEIHGLSVFPQIVHRAAYLSLGNVPPGNIVALIPAAFMTAVCVTYICVASIGLNLPLTWNWPIGIAVFVLSLATFFLLRRRNKKNK